MKTIFVALFIFIATLAWAAEDLTLITGIQHNTTLQWRVTWMRLDWDSAAVEVNFKDPSNPSRQVVCTETGALALAFMSQLNTANLSANSLQRRTIIWAIGKGCLGAGTISGTPE